MSDEQIFAIASSAPLLAWLGLCFAPLRRGAVIVFARFVAISLCVAYLLMIAAALTRPGGAAPDLTTLAGLAKAFSDPHVMLIGWLHYLAFDLWIGSWIVEEAGQRRVPNAAIVPCLVLTLLAGPLGLLAFLAARSAFGREPLRPPSAP